MSEQLSVAVATVVSLGAKDVLDERQRHVDGEGFAVEHDDRYHRSELIKAAKAYLACVLDRRIGGKLWANASAMAWPWSSAWWKPRNDRRDLVRAAALLIAEIDRMDRRAVDHGHPLKVTLEAASDAGAIGLTVGPEGRSGGRIFTCPPRPVAFDPTTCHRTIIEATPRAGLALSSTLTARVKATPPVISGSLP